MPKFQFAQRNLPGIPRAPVLRFASDIAFEKVKQQCQFKLPILDADEIVKCKAAHKSLFQQLLASGYHLVVEEILTLKELEDAAVQNFTRPNAIIIKNTTLLSQIAKTLKICSDLDRESKYFLSANTRFQLGQTLMLKKDYWLAKHFFVTALSTVSRLDNQGCKDTEFEAKVHCLLAYMIYKDSDNSPNYHRLVAEAVSHLENARFLSRGTTWRFESRSKLVDGVRIKKPAAIIGLRQDFLKINFSTTTLYEVATIIYFDILMKMSAQALLAHSNNPTQKEIELALKLSSEALGLAKEIENWTAISSALLFNGIILRESGDLLQALDVFHTLHREAEGYRDFETQAIACGNIALCLQRRRFPVEALTWLDKQKSLSFEKGLPEMEADSIERSGAILLEEGQSAEAEQAYFNAYKGLLSVHETHHHHQKKLNLDDQLKPIKSVTIIDLDSEIEMPSKKSQPPNQIPQANYNKQSTNSDQKNPKIPGQRPDDILDITWGFTGIAAGIHLWGRLAGHCRQDGMESGGGGIEQDDEHTDTDTDRTEAFNSLIKFKDMRTQMVKVPPPPTSPTDIHEVFEDYDEQKKIPIINNFYNEAYIRETYKEIMKIVKDKTHIAHALDEDENEEKENAGNEGFFEAKANENENKRKQQQELLKLVHDSCGGSGVRSAISFTQDFNYNYDYSKFVNRERVNQVCRREITYQSAGQGQGQGQGQLGRNNNNNRQSRQNSIESGGRRDLGLESTATDMDNSNLTDYEVEVELLNKIGPKYKSDVRLGNSYEDNVAKLKLMGKLIYATATLMGPVGGISLSRSITPRQLSREKGVEKRVQLGVKSVHHHPKANAKLGSNDDDDDDGVAKEAGAEIKNFHNLLLSRKSLYNTGVVEAKQKFQLTSFSEGDDEAKY